MVVHIEGCEKQRKFDTTLFKGSRIMSSRRLYSLLLFSILPLFAKCNAQDVKSSGSVQVQGQKFRMTRTVFGTIGSEQGGRYIIEDPRTVFYTPDDKQVIAYFEWEGPTGEHTIEANWKNPRGKIVNSSDFKYDARTRVYAGFYTLLISSSVETGIWQIETHIDGESAGIASFQIIAESRPSNLVLEKRMLNLQDLYRRAVAATVKIEKLDPAGKVIDVGAGFAVADGSLITAFQIIDGATALRVTNSEGVSINVEFVLAWNRWKDWAVLKGNGIRTGRLPVAEQSSISVGDRCFALNTGEDGTHTIVEGIISGTSENPQKGKRILSNATVSYLSAGSPLLNEYGEVYALVGGVPLPGFRSLHANKTTWIISGNLAQMEKANNELQGIPISEFIKTERKEFAMRQMLELKQFTPPLIDNGNSVNGTMAVYKGKANQMLSYSDEKYEFTEADKQFIVYLYWYPKVKQKGIATIQIFNAGNQLVGESKQTKITLNPKEQTQSYWLYDIASFPTGTYRIDLVMENQPIWRTFFKINK